MCFSSNASFIAGAALMVTGVAAVRKTNNVKQLPFAAIPLIFSLQQISEGFLWRSFSNSELSHLSNVFTYAFVVFAQVVWPVWIPFSILLLERKQTAKKILKIFLITGALVSAYLFFCLVNYPVNSYFADNHIFYQLDFPHNDYKWFSGIFYVSATVLPMLVSRQGIWMKMLGIGILLSLLISGLFFRDHVISVWCYFAAILSVIIFVIIRKTNEGTARI